MNWNWKEFNKQNHLFRTYYCLECKQTKPCRLLSNSKCCACYFQNEEEKIQEYSSYERVLIRKQKEQSVKYKQYQLLKDYQGCKCGSKEVDAYSLYENSRLVCQSCLAKETGGSSSPVSFIGQQKWYRKFWGIDLNEWLTKFQCLPANDKCAREWVRDRNHLNSCDCLEREVKNLTDLFTNSLKRYQEKLKECKCIKSKKVRIDSDYSTECERCQKPISVTSKKRVIKNRNDPRFWGLNIQEKLLCGSCLESKKGEMKPLRRAKFNEYRKLGML